MADTKISGLTALTGANVDTAADVMAVVDTDVATTKKILVDELAVALAATQAEVNAMTSTNTLLTPNVNKIVLGTEQASTSGTAIDFTGIPAGTRRITVHFRGVSTNGTSNIIVQLGDAGGIENTGYVGGANNSSGATIGAFSAGFVAMVGVLAAKDANGHIALVLEDSSDFTWSMNGMLASSDALAFTMSAGYKPLSAELTQLRITMANGTDAFDAGAINISYER